MTEFKPTRLDDEIVDAFSNLFTASPPDDLQQCHDIQALAEFLGWLDPHWDENSTPAFETSILRYRKTQNRTEAEWYREVRSRLQYFLERSGLAAPGS